MTTLTPTPHKQVSAKANVFVDEEIKDLVEALNRLDDRLCTWHSCQGYEGELASVSMRYGRVGEHSCVEMAEVAHRLVEMIKRNMADETEPMGYGTRVALEWAGDKRYPFITIQIPRHEIAAITTAFCDKRGLPTGCSEGK